MNFIIIVEDIYKVDLNKFQDYCKKNGYEKEINVKTGLKTIISSDNSELELSIFNYEKVVPLKGKYLGDILDESPSNIECKIKGETDIDLFLLFVDFINKNTNIILFDSYKFIYLNSKDFEDKYSKDLDRLKEQIKIHLKYSPILNDLAEKAKKNSINIFNGVYTGTLIVSSLFAALLLIYMILNLKITNSFILSLPFIVVVLLHLIKPIKVLIVGDQIGRKRIDTLYAQAIDLNNLYNLKIPKKPSYIKKERNTKQTFINISGILIIPGIIIGTILLTKHNYIWGTIVILLPWILLLLTKFLITDQETNNVEETLVALTKKFFNTENDFVAIKYQIVEENNYNWRIEIGGYKEFNLETMNKVDTKNELILNKDLMASTRYNATWEEVERLVQAIIIRRVARSDDFNKNEKLKTITIGFIDDVEFLVLSKNFREK